MGFSYSVVSSDPLRLKYSTQTARPESELIPLEARLFDRDWRFPSKEKLRRMNPQYQSLELSLRSSE